MACNSILLLNKEYLKNENWFKYINQQPSPLIRKKSDSPEERSLDQIHTKIPQGIVSSANHNPEK